MNVTKESEEQTIIQTNGYMTAKDAAKKLGVKIGFFRSNVSPIIGTYVGHKKYFTEDQLTEWVKSFKK